MSDGNTSQIDVESIQRYGVDITETSKKEVILNINPHRGLDIKDMTQSHKEYLHKRKIRMVILAIIIFYIVFNFTCYQIMVHVLNIPWIIVLLVIIVLNYMGYCLIDYIK